MFQLSVQTGRSIMVDMGVGKFGDRIEIGIPADIGFSFGEDVSEKNATAYHIAILAIAEEYRMRAHIKGTLDERGGRFNLTAPGEKQRCADELALCDASCTVYIMQLSPPRI